MALRADLERRSGPCTVIEGEVAKENKGLGTGLVASGGSIMKQPKTSQRSEPADRIEASQDVRDGDMARIVAHLIAVLKRASKARGGAKRS